MLEGGWGITDRASAIETLNFLKDEGHRYYFPYVVKALQQPTQEALNNYIKDIIQNEDRAERAVEFIQNVFYSLDELKKWKVINSVDDFINIGVDAWDSGRLSFIVRLCCEAKLISEEEAWLLSTVEAQARQWSLKTPEVAIYHSPEPNAFATGATRNSSLVAVSTGLLDHMTRDEVEAVLAHEMAHVGNGDMVTLTLIQGVVNTFVVFLARVVSGMVARNNDGSTSQGTYFMVSMVLQIVFGFLASIIVMWFSRQREYRADAGAAKLVGAHKMIAALQRLKGSTSDLPEQMNAMGIASDAKDSLLSTHPSLDNRIARLKNL